MPIKEHPVVSHDVTIASRIVPCDHGGQIVIAQRCGHKLRIDREMGMTVTPVYGWRLPVGGEAASGPEAFSELALDIENTLSGVGVSTYTPSWTSTGSQQPSNPSTKTGRYRLANGWCDFCVVANFGASTSGGKGNLFFGLPVNASSQISEQIVRAKLYLPNYANWSGLGLIMAGGDNVGPFFPTSATNVSVQRWRSTDEAGTAGQGIPNMPGLYAVVNGGNCIVSGRYLVA